MAAAAVMLYLMHRQKMKSKKKVAVEKLSGEMGKLKRHKDKRLLCRICLKEGEVSLFDGYSSVDTIEYIKIFAGIKLDKDDNLPQYLCTNCNDVLSSAILFRQQAQQTDKKLRKLYSSKDNDGKQDSFDDDCADNEPTWQDLDIKEEENKKYECRKCQMEFIGCNDYIEHLRSEQHKRPRIPCPQCNVSFVASYLHVHMSRAHSTERPFVCEVCGKSFTVKHAFKRHLYIHSNELPFKCPQCPYRGRFNESLKGHMRVHTGEKPYSCHQCAARFICASNLKKHLRTHLTDYDFKCNICERGFHSEIKMKEHVRVDHTGIKEHHCDMCGKAFGYRKQLMKHTRKVHQRPKMRQGKLPLYLQMQGPESGEPDMEQAG